MRRTLPPPAEIQTEIDKLLSKGMVDDPQKMLGDLARLGATAVCSATSGTVARICPELHSALPRSRPGQ